MVRLLKDMTSLHIRAFEIHIEEDQADQISLESQVKELIRLCGWAKLSLSLTNVPFHDNFVNVQCFPRPQG